MIANRPLIYLTLPSLALIIGYVWLRRKKGGRAVCDSGGGNAKEQKSVKLNDKIQQNKNYKLVDNPVLNDQLETYSPAHNSHHSESLPIGKISSSQQQINKYRNESPSSLIDQDQRSQSPQSTGSNSSSTSSLCKSAPIDIAPNPRSPPKRITEQDVDSEILKLIPQNQSDIKNLRFIEETEIDWNDSPTPADSPLYRDRFDLSQNQPKVEPVVIKGTREAKISPENSFRERKYTQTESDDCEPTSNQNINNNEFKMNEVIENGSIANITKTKTLTDSGCDAEVVSTNDNTTAVVNSQPQISSPALSVCSMRSGDSGQGSSPPQSICAPQISYEFLIPVVYIGALIGPRGRIITDIKEKTGANVIIQKTSHGSISKRQRVCSVEGTLSEVEAALKLIRSTLPEKKYRLMTMERIFVTPDNHVAPMPIFNTSTLNVS
jgi:A-kinase anchor protein 1, mitochondrial